MKVAIVGSGLIGRSWAVLFSRAGCTVCLYDISTSQLKEAEKAVENQLKVLENYGLLRTGQTAAEVVKAVSFSADLKEAVEGAEYIQECVPENLEMKKKVFSSLDLLVNDGVILASSTSSIIPSILTKDLQHRAQCIVAHPANPPHYVPLVEVIPAPWTDQSVIDRTIDLMKDLGQAPILVKKEINGFILNRLQYALVMEAWRLVEDGVASPQDVDAAISQGLGIKYSFMGAFETMHLNATGMHEYCQRYGDMISTICNTQERPRPLSGDTLETVSQAMVPLDQLEERRKWRDNRLAALAVHKIKMQKEEDSTSTI